MASLLALWCASLSAVSQVCFEHAHQLGREDLTRQALLRMGRQLVGEALNSLNHQNRRVIEPGVSDLRVETQETCRHLHCLPFASQDRLAQPRRQRCLLVVLFMAPIVAIPLVPQARYQSAGLASTVTGALLLACAVCLWASALRAMRGVPSMREVKGLVTTGAYGLVRNPLYSADALLLPGLGLLTQSLASLFFAPLVIALFLVQSVLEEGGLRAECGAEYTACRERVRHRLLPFVL